MNKAGRIVAVIVFLVFVLCYTAHAQYDSGESSLEEGQEEMQQMDSEMDVQPGDSLSSLEEEGMDVQPGDAIDSEGTGAH